MYAGRACAPHCSHFGKGEVAFICVRSTDKAYSSVSRQTRSAQGTEHCHSFIVLGAIVAGEARMLGSETRDQVRTHELRKPRRDQSQPFDGDHQPV